LRGINPLQKKNINLSEEERLQGRFYDFIQVLIDAGIAISTAEVLDMFTALQYVNFNDRPSFKQTLSSTLVKDFTDLPIFEKCFKAFFDRKGKGVKQFSLQGIGTLTPLDEYLTPEEMQEVQNLILQLMNLPDDELREMTEGDIRNLLMNAPIIASSSLLSIFTNAPAGGQTDDTHSPEQLRNIQSLVSYIRQRIDERRTGKAIQEREDYLLNKPIYQLTPGEVNEMRELVKRFGQKLKNRISLRKKRVKRGSFDIKKTIRSNLQYGGTIFRIYYKDRKIDRPQLVVLCDISSSVNQYSRFMLLLTYTLQSLFSKVRTFAFISNIVEITPLFTEMEPERAINSIFSDTSFTYGWGSNYGRCFKQFFREFSDSLNNKTSVLILGDARNNYQDPGLESFINICSRTRNVFWLNPDKHHLWDWGDSIATIYNSYCTEMREVNSFVDLSEFIDKLFVR